MGSMAGKYNTREIANELDDLVRLLNAQVLQLEVLGIYETGTFTLSGLHNKLKEIKEMATYLYDIKEMV